MRDFILFSDEIFVFGSNLKGIHGKGAALTARKNYGAILGQGRGRQGNSYAIPTKLNPYVSLELEEIKNHVQIFLAYARSQPDLKFVITRIGCGHAGYTNAQIAPMFHPAPINCFFEFDWFPYLER